MASKRNKLLQANSMAIKENKIVEENSIVSPTGDNLVDETLKELNRDAVEKKIAIQTQSEKPIVQEVLKENTTSSQPVSAKPVASSNKTDGIHIVLKNEESSNAYKKKNKKSNFVGLKVTDKALAAINALVQMNGEETRNWVINKHFEQLADEMNITWERPE